MTKALPYEGTLTLNSKDDLHAKIRFRVREITAARGEERIAVAVATDFDETIVYLANKFENQFSTGADECLYLYGKVTGILPLPPAEQGYLAVDLHGYRLSEKGAQAGIDMRNLIARWISEVGGAGKHPIRRARHTAIHDGSHCFLLT